MTPQPKPIRPPKAKRPIQRKARVKKRSRRGASRAKLDQLMGEIVKARGECEAGLKCAGVHPSKQVLQSCHGWGKKAYPATRYVRENLWCMCSGCHKFFTHHNHEWVEWMQAHMEPGTYERVRAVALANEKLDYKAIEADLRLRVAQLRARLSFAEAVS